MTNVRVSALGWAAGGVALMTAAVVIVPVSDRSSSAGEALKGGSSQPENSQEAPQAPPDVTSAQPSPSGTGGGSQGEGGKPARTEGEAGAAPATELVPLEESGQPVPHPTLLSDGNVVPLGFPSARTTGVPTGKVLTSQVGDVVINIDNTVLDGIDLIGCVVVQANNVAIKRSKIRCSGDGSTPFPVRIMPGFRDLLLEDVEIDGMGRAPVAVMGDNWAARRIDVHSTVDGPRLGSDTSLEDSYVHDLARLPGSHNDALQTIGGTGILVRGNTLLAYNRHTDDPMNGVIQTGKLLSPLADVLVEGNYMNGGSYTVRGGSGPRDGGLIERYVIRDNLIGRECGFGPADGVEPPVTWEGNRWLDTGRVISRDHAFENAGCTKSHRSRNPPA